MLGQLSGSDGEDDCSRGGNVAPFTPLCLLYSFLSASGPLYVLGPNLMLSLSPQPPPMDSMLHAVSAAVLSVHSRCRPSPCKLQPQLLTKLHIKFSVAPHSFFHAIFCLN